MSNKGFTLIEVLVASIILFLSILTVNAAYKQYVSYKTKQQKYENIYIAAISLMNEIEGENISQLEAKKREINGLKYTLSIQSIASKRNYAIGLETNQTKNNGLFLITLYKITIKMENRTFVLFKTEYQKIK